MTTPILVTIEHAPKKTFASAADWPGWRITGLAVVLVEGGRQMPG